MNPIIINMPEAFEEAIQSEQPVLVEFYKIGCPYCEAIEPLMATAASELGNHIKVYVFQMDREQTVAYKEQYEFKYVPRCAIFSKGTLLELFNTSSEVLTLADLKALVFRHLK